MSNEALIQFLGLLASIFAGIRWLMQANQKLSAQNMSLKNELTTRSISEMRKMVTDLSLRLGSNEAKQREFQEHMDATVLQIQKANAQTIATVQEYTFATEKKMKLFEGRLSEIIELSNKPGGPFMVKGPKKDQKT